MRRARSPFSAHPSRELHSLVELMLMHANCSKSKKTRVTQYAVRSASSCAHRANPAVRRKALVAVRPCDIIADSVETVAWHDDAQTAMYQPSARMEVPMPRHHIPPRDAPPPKPLSAAALALI